MKQYLVERGKNEGVDSFLHRLYNDLGFTDLCISYNYQNHGPMMFSKWIPYTKIMHMERENKLLLLNKITHRSILDIEIMFDIDEQEPYKSIVQKAAHIYHGLKEEGYEPITYFTGSKSYHISIIETNLRKMSSYLRSTLKRKKIALYGCDLMKSASRCMIAMEGAKHYKSGKRKRRIHWI